MDFIKELLNILNENNEENNNNVENVSIDVRGVQLKLKVYFNNDNTAITMIKANYGKETESEKEDNSEEANTKRAIKGIHDEIEYLKRAINVCVANQTFEKAIEYRERIKHLENQLLILKQE